MKSDYELIVIGAGPAGMAAALQAAHFGTDVAVIDDQPYPGGQVYRQVDHSPLTDADVLGTDYAYGKQQVLSFRQAKIDYIANASVWFIDDSGLIGVLLNDDCHSVRAQKVIIAGGAQERPMPFPGWQLPGVMTAGAGQVMLKSAGLIPESVVLAGSGPLLLLLVTQYLKAGVKIRALIDTRPVNSWVKSLRYLLSALSAIDYLIKGLRMVLAIRRAGIPVYRNVSDLRAEGDDQLEAIAFQSAGKPVRLETELLLIHQGVIPALQLSQLAGCEHTWDESQQCWTTRSNRWGKTSLDNVFVAGDGSKIIGARAANLSGRLAGLQVCYELNKLDESRRDKLAAPLRQSMNRHSSIRPFLDTFYRVTAEFIVPADDTMICRCEEVYASEIRQVAQHGCLGPNQAKAFSRCGMGPCQGRQCGQTVSAILAEAQQCSPKETGFYRVRPPIKPVTLGQLARMDERSKLIQNADTQ